MLYLLWWDKPQSVGVQLLLHPRLKLIDPDGATLEGQGRWEHTVQMLYSPVSITERSEWRTQLRVPTMWWSHISNSPGGFDTLFFFAPVIGLLFGAVHCIAWNFSFPSTMKRTLWRVCAIAVGVGPIFALLLTIVTIILGALLNVPPPFDEHLSDMVLILPYLSFFIARAGLLVLSVTALRTIPTSGYQTVPWLSYIPHL